MKLRPRRPDPVGQRLFDIHMNIFELLPKLELITVDLLFYLREPVEDRLQLFFREQTVSSQHGRVGLAAGDVVAIEARVVID